MLNLQRGAKIVYKKYSMYKVFLAYFSSFPTKAHISATNQNSKVQPSNKLIKNIAKLCGCFRTLAIHKGRNAIHKQKIISIPAPNPPQKFSKIAQ